MSKKTCPKCNHKSLRYRSTTTDYICDHNSCEAIFNENLKEVHVKGKGIIRDKNGNYYKIKIEKELGIIRHIKTYFLETDRTTLRGGYEKFRKDSDCKYPERLSCNYGIGFKRCEYMEYEGSFGNWKCTYNKNLKT